MAAVAAAGATCGQLTSPSVRLRPAQAIRAAHDPRAHMSRAQPGGSGVARRRPLRAPAMPGWRRVGVRPTRIGRGDDPALNRLRARED